MSRLAIPAVLLALLLLVATGCGGVDKSAYVAHNESVFHTVAPYPGAHLVNNYSIGIPKPGNWSENGAPYGAFVTTHFYRLPKPASAAAVLAYYRSELRSWRVVAGTGTCEETLDNFSTGAMLYVAACSRGSMGFMLQVDYRGGRPS